MKFAKHLFMKLGLRLALFYFFLIASKLNAAEIQRSQRTIVGSCSSLFMSTNWSRERAAPPATAALNELLVTALQEYRLDASSYLQIKPGVAQIKLISPDSQTSIFAIMKQENGHRQRINSETLAYTLSELLDLGHLLPLVSRVVNNTRVSLQVKSDGILARDWLSQASQMPEMKEAQSEIERELLFSEVFDFLIGDEVDGQKPEHKLVDQCASLFCVHSIDKGDAFFKGDRLDPWKRMRFVGLIRTREGADFFKKIAAASGELVIEVERVYGSGSDEALAFRSRLQQLLDLLLIL